MYAEQFVGADVSNELLRWKTKNQSKTPRIKTILISTVPATSLPSKPYRAISSSEEGE